MLPAAANASAATPAPANPDAELIALAAQIADLRIQSEAADAKHDRCYEVYRSIAPQLSRKLIWRVSDAGLVGYSRILHQLEDGKTYLFCDLNDVDGLRGRTSFGQWSFVGTEEERERLGLQNWCDNRIKPIDGYDHLFVSTGAEWQQKRARELIAALDEYKAAEEAADVASGWSAADEARYEISERISERIDRMLELPPSTLEGYQAMDRANAAV